ncbi:MAG: zinc-ribbon domain-containing protein [Clostridia bacterium]|nr:zinc-ribbon domain-containing protein [Clostridia bacterium]
MNFCKNCGAQNDPGVKFCQKCGSPMVPTAPVAPAAPVSGYATTPYTPAPTELPGKGLGIAGMVLGIIAVVLFCLWYISIPCGIAGIILSCVASGKAKEVGMSNGMAKAGVVCSAIALGIAVTYIFLGVVVGISLL